MFLAILLTLGIPFAQGQEGYPENPPALMQGGDYDLPFLYINEILFDPVPAVSLPDQEYIELYNSDRDTIDLAGWRLNGGLLPETPLYPGEYLVVCKKGQEDRFKAYGKSAGIAPWDVLNNDGQLVRLEDAAGRVVDEIYYSPELINDDSKKNGGWSIEMKNPSEKCKGAFNWDVSDDASGGTPGRKNSIHTSEPDNHPPEITGMNWIREDMLQIIFSEPMESVNDGFRDLFRFEPEWGILHVIPDVADPVSILLELDQKIRKGALFSISISGVRDCMGIPIKDTLVRTGLGRMPVFDEILITELMVDETPSAGLPESEYIEIKNVTNDLLDLENTYFLWKEDKTLTFPCILVMPGHYLVFCPRSRLELFLGMTGLYGISPFPGLLNEGMALALYNGQDQLVFSLRYEKNWYHDAEKSTGGYSLEMVDTANPCGEEGNWSASVDPRGGTPGHDNSVIAINPDMTGPYIRNVYAPDAHRLEVELSEKIHPATLNDMQIRIEKAGNHILSSIDSLFFDSFTLNFEQPLVSNIGYSILISGLKDCVGNAIDPSKDPSTFFLPKQVDPGDIVINEILFNPRPGGVDWIELINRSDNYLDLSDIHFNGDNADGGMSVPETAVHRTMAPAGITVYTEDRNKLLADFPESRPEAIIEIDPMPEMPDQFGQVILVNGTGKVIDLLNYNSDFHYDLITDDEGISLERISADMPSDDPGNWQSASPLYGSGSPTFMNPNQLASGSGKNLLETEPEILTPDGDGFDDVLQIRYHTGIPGFSANLEVYDIRGRKIKNILKNILLPPEGTVLWDGHADNGLVPETGIYILRFELYNLEGDYRQVKKSLVIANNW